MGMGMGFSLSPAVQPLEPPWNILGLEPYLWLRADQGTVAGSSGIATWQDQSGNGRHFTAASGPEEPTLNATAINGHPGLVGDGVNTLMTGAAFTGAAETGSVDVFIVFVCDEDPTATGLGGRWQLGSPGTTEDYVPFANGLIYCGIFSTARKSTNVAMGAHYFETPRLFEVHSAANAWEMLTDGASRYTDNTNTVSNGAAGDPALFGDPEASSARLDGAIGEVLIFAPSLADEDRALVRAELATRWGLSL